MRPVTVTVKAPLLQAAVAPPGLAVTVYAVMAAFYFKLVSSLTLAFVDALANIAPLVLTLLIITYGGMTPRFYTRTKPSLASHLISKEV